VGREDLASIEGDDRDFGLVDDGQDPPMGARRTDLEVVQAIGPAQGDPALPVGDVVAQADVAGCATAGGMRLGRRGIGLGRGDPSDGPVGPLFVVREAEAVELG
jgi:hypothetical protein